MTKTLLTLLLLTFGSMTNQTIAALLPESPISEIGKNTFLLNYTDTLRFSTDSEYTYNYLSLKFASGNSYIDSVYLTSYAINFNLFDINEFTSILLFEVENEHYSDYPVYHISSDTVTFIGTLNIQADCTECDFLGYPIKDIQLEEDDGLIYFSFIEPLKLIHGQTSIPKDQNEFKYIIALDKMKLIAN